MNRKNIAVVGRFHDEAFGLHIVETLEEMGHCTYRVDPYDDVRLSHLSLIPRVGPLKKVHSVLAPHIFASEAYSHSLCKTIQQKLGNVACDLILATHDFLSPVSLDLLSKEFDCKLALWFPDHLAALGRCFMVTGLYDHLFFKDPFIVARFRNELSLRNTHYLPECCNPLRMNLPPDEKVKEVVDLGTAGNFHPSRAAVFQHLTAQGFEIVLWGPPISSWMKQFSKGISSRGYVANQDKTRAFRSCKIVLNTTHPAEVDSTNVRTFEIAATGSFQLVNHRAALVDLFDLQEELVTFDSLDNLTDKIRYYLPRHEERKHIGARAKQRVLQEHTYKQRLNRLLETVFPPDESKGNDCGH